jgi:hypothetical protein
MESVVDWSKETMQAEYDVYRNITAIYNMTEMMRPETPRASSVDPERGREI